MGNFCIGIYLLLQSYDFNSLTKPKVSSFHYVLPFGLQEACVKQLLCQELSTVLLNVQHFFLIPSSVCLHSPLFLTSFQVRGYPEPQITWYRNGHPLPEGDHYVVDHSIRGIFSLVIKGVQEGDSGKYTCEAANDGGVRQVTVELTVEGKTILKLPL